MSQRLASPRMRTTIARAAEARDAGLRLVGPVRARAARVPFVVVMITVVAIGLTGLVLLSTVLQAQAFAIRDLRVENRDLVMHKQQLSDHVNELSSPASLADQATAQGMVPPTSPVFLRISDGTILGVPTPAVEGTP